MLIKSPVLDVLRFSRSDHVSLSKYFPKDTSYFYGYPSGEESGFLNCVPAATEELVSARPLVCAGANVNVITFANAIRSDMRGLIHGGLGSTLLNKNRTHVLPSHIDGKVAGNDRNEQVKHCLKRFVRPGSLVMAQPFLDEDMRHLYQISPRLTLWLNDKKNMSIYIPKELLPKRYAAYKNGKDFSAAKRKFPFPCVVKVSSSSAGDGVHICRDEKMLENTRQILKRTKGGIFVEEYIVEIANHGIQFGIPSDPNLPIDIIGVNQQLTTPDGEFIGGVIDRTRHYKELDAVKDDLVNKILPQVRELGWYGVGCVDVLTDKDGHTYIIDCNFRMTGMTAYLMLAANGQIKPRLVSFSGEINSTLEEFYDILKKVPHVGGDKQKIHILALTETDGICRFNAAILYDMYDEITATAKSLLGSGVTSKVLDFFCY